MLKQIKEASSSMSDITKDLFVLDTERPTYWLGPYGNFLFNGVVSPQIAIRARVQRGLDIDDGIHKFLATLSIAKDGALFLAGPQLFSQEYNPTNLEGIFQHGNMSLALLSAAAIAFTGKKFADLARDIYHAVK